VYSNYVLDFDDTLVVGPMTWAMSTALPELMARHGLPTDQPQLDVALLRAQEMTATQFDENLLIETFLADMGWSEALREDLERMLTADFQFALFEDTMPFLQGLREREIRTIVISNNNRCPRIARTLGIEGYIERFFTPKMGAGCQNKPDRSMFDLASVMMPELTTDNTVVVGDDPWSDAAFATNCGLPCWIVDRHDRYAGMTMMGHATRIRELRMALPG
jgi:FMN phosphatase YigB (HAD superfamily)